MGSIMQGLMGEREREREKERDGENVVGGTLYLMCKQASKDKQRCSIITDSNSQNVATFEAGKHWKRNKTS
jgi:hypothetical protein